MASADWSPESACGDHDYFEDNQSSGYGVELEVDINATDMHIDKRNRRLINNKLA